MNSDHIHDKPHTGQDAAAELVDTLPSAVLIFDRNLKLLTVNKATCTLLGYDNKEALIGKSLKEVSPNVTADRLEAYEHVLETGEPVQIVDEVDHPTVGKKLWHIQVFKVGEGIALVSEDVTEKDAYHRLAEMAAQLRAKKRELEELRKGR